MQYSSQYYLLHRIDHFYWTISISPTNHAAGMNRSNNQSNLSSSFSKSNSLSNANEHHNKSNKDNRLTRKPSFLKRTGARVYGSLKRSSFGQFLNLSDKKPSSSSSSSFTFSSKVNKRRPLSSSFSKMYSLERNEGVALVGGSTPASKDSLFATESNFELRRHHSDILFNSRDDHSVSKARFARFKSLMGDTIADRKYKDNNSLLNIGGSLRSKSPIIPETILEYRESFIGVLLQNEELLQGILYVTNIFILFQSKGVEPSRLRIDLDAIITIKKEDYEYCANAIRIFTEEDIFLLVNIPNRNQCYHLIMNELNSLYQGYFKSSIPKMKYPIRRGIINPIFIPKLVGIESGCECIDHYPIILLNRVFDNILGIEFGRLLFFNDPELPPLLAVYRQLKGIIIVSDTGWIKNEKKNGDKVKEEDKEKEKEKEEKEEEENNQSNSKCPCRLLIMNVPDLLYPKVSSRMSIRQFLRFESLDKVIVEEIINIDDNENYEILVRRCHQTILKIKGNHNDNNSCDNNGECGNSNNNPSSSSFSFSSSNCYNFKSTTTIANEMEKEVIKEQSSVFISFKLIELKNLGISKEIMEKRIKSILTLWYEEELDSCYQRIMEHKNNNDSLIALKQKKKDHSNVTRTDGDNRIFIFIYSFLSFIFIILDIWMLKKIYHGSNDHLIVIDTSKNYKDRIEEMVKELVIKEESHNDHYIKDIEDSVNNLRLILNNLQI